MKKQLLLLTLLLLISSNVSAQRTKSVLLPSEEAKKAARQCSRPSPEDFTGTWAPSVEQIKAMESKLKEIAQLTAQGCCIEGARIEDPEEWYLQYAALVWKGRKIIYINAVSRSEPKRGPCADKNGIITNENCELWRHYAAIVCDGGTKWGVIYDVNTGKFSDLAVNGVG